MDLAVIPNEKSRTLEYLEGESNPFFLPDTNHNVNHCQYLNIYGSCFTVILSCCFDMQLLKAWVFRKYIIWVDCFYLYYVVVLITSAHTIPNLVTMDFDDIGGYAVATVSILFIQVQFFKMQIIWHVYSMLCFYG